MQELPNGLYLLVKEEADAAHSRADDAQRYMWEAFEDDLIGLPEAEPRYLPLKIDRKRQPFWRNLTFYR